MADFVLSRPDIFSGRVCLELGSGTGLAGICLAQQAKSTILTGDCLADEMLSNNSK